RSASRASCSSRAPATNGARCTSLPAPASMSCRRRSDCMCPVSSARSASSPRFPRWRIRPRPFTKLSATPCGRWSRRCACGSTPPEAFRVFENDLITVYRSAHRRECNDRLLVLTAVGVEAVITAADGAFLLQVAPQDAGYAIRHLLQYESENRPPPAPPPPP